MSTLISNDHLPAGERFDCWRQTLCQVRLAPVEVWAENEADYRFKMCYCDLGTIRMSLYTAMSYHVRRTPQLIRESSPDLLAIGMVLRGHASISLPGRQADLTPGTFCLYETCRPYHIDAAAPGASTGQWLMMAFPRTLLPLPAGKLRQVTAVTMPPGPGIGTLASQLLVQLATSMDHYTPAQAARLSTAALEVLAIRLAHELDTDQSVPPETRRRALLTSIHAFIQRHISDPGLSPDTIAAAHHISLRLLHKLFHEEGETVAGWIRTRRLEGTPPRPRRPRPGHPPRRRPRGTLGIPQPGQLQPHIPRRLRTPAPPVPPHHQPRPQPRACRNLIRASQAACSYSLTIPPGQPVLKGAGRGKGDVAAGALIQVISGSSYGFKGPDAIASDGTDVWVVNNADQSITGFPA